MSLHVYTFSNLMASQDRMACSKVIMVFEKTQKIVFVDAFVCLGEHIEYNDKHNLNS